MPVMPGKTALLELLKQEGVRIMFGNPGTTELPLMDAFVLCSRVSPKATVIREPVVVFEVLSESTARTDHIEKLREYAATTSILRYVILEQDSIGAMVFTRKDGQFVAETMTEGDTLRMPEIGVEVVMADFYEGPDMSAGIPDTP